jgi:hypothetical protein
MGIKVHSVWEGVPDAAGLGARLATAKDVARPMRERQEALSYLSGATKVMLRLESRTVVAEYLQAQISTIKSKLYY